MSSRGIDAWLKTNPGKTLTIYDLLCIIKNALQTTFTPANITSGFAATGIFPFDTNVFQESDFSPSYVTVRPHPREDQQKLSNEFPGHSSNKTPKRDPSFPKSWTEERKQQRQKEEEVRHFDGHT